MFFLLNYVITFLLICGNIESISLYVIGISAALLLQIYGYLNNAQQKLDTCISEK